MNEMEMENGKRIYVGRAQRKIERQGELRDKFEKLKEERLKRYQVSKTRIVQFSLFKAGYTATPVLQSPSRVWVGWGRI